jgi:hypothetical protein
MKTLFFILATSFLFSAFSYGQTITAKIIINDDPNRHYFSRSEHNSIKVKGTGCERFELRGVGVALVERSGDYYVQLKSGQSAQISIYGILGDKRMILGTYRISIVN